MSIKRNIKRRMLMVVALAMTVAVLAAGTAQAQHQSEPVQTSLTQTPSAPQVMVGEPVTFHITVTNEEPYTIPVTVWDYLPAYVQFDSASSSQGQCTFDPAAGEYGVVKCEVDTLPPGGTAQIDVVMVPQQVTLIKNEVGATGPSWSGASVDVEPAS